MTKQLLFAAAFSLAIAASAQGTATQPEALQPGEKTIAVDWNSGRQTGFYSYTAENDDQLLTLILPTPEATVVATNTSGDFIDSNISCYCVGSIATQTSQFKCLAPKGSPVYLKISFATWLLPENAKNFSISVDAEDYEINYGLDSNDPIILSDASPSFLPLTVQTEPPFMPTPVYAGYDVEKSGWLYLDFTPSVTKIEYAVDGETEFTTLKHEYILEYGKTIGAKAMLEVDKDEKILFRISGFNAATLSTAIENPEEGKSCDFPKPAEWGVLTIPAEAGDYYWSITPENEGLMVITAENDVLSQGGFVEVMMDCQGTGSLKIDDILRMRKWVYDRMEYIIHVSKKAATEEPTTFNMDYEEPQSYDRAFTAPLLEADKEYVTPAFRGTYYYMVKPDCDCYLSLETLCSPPHPDTRVNLYNAEDLTETLARGFDLYYAAEAGAEYILEWNVFDNELAIPFKIAIDERIAVSEIDPDSAEEDEYFTLQGVAAGKDHNNLPAGVYIVKRGSTYSKILK